MAIDPVGLLYDKNSSQLQDIKLTKYHNQSELMVRTFT
jgi:hypothetical protein